MSWANPKRLVVVPLVVAVFSALVLAARGLPLGMDMEGGTRITVRGLETSPNTSEIEKSLREAWDTDKLRVTTTRNTLDNTFGLTIDTPLALSYEQELRGMEILAGKLGFSSSEEMAYDKKHVGPIIGEEFKRQGVRAVVLAFIFVGIVVFIAFRHVIVSLAVMFCILLDLLVAAAAMSLSGVELGLPSIAALLMVLGYSVDSNILLSSRLFRRRGGTPLERIRDGMKTGLTMTGTTLFALLVLFIVTTSDVLREIAAVLIFALLADVMNTWMLNA
ncbi:MAG: protein translocase subunit SecF, partial [Methanobacteriota archaeon]